MSRFVLAISIGPVQEFIAASRRTRDLWFGSHLLSEISKAAALAAPQPRDELIFPARDWAVRDDAHVANVILAIVRDPDGAVRRAREAARQKWNCYANAVLEQVRPAVEETRWERQADPDDVLEFYAAWAPMPDEAGYKAARRSAMRLLAGRKACRNFTQWNGEARVPKSSLDGARERIWKSKEAPETLDERVRRRMRLRDAEQLDAIGLVKRLGGEHDAYPSVSRVAADPWLRGLGKSRRDEMLRQRCEELAKRGLLVRVRHYPAFPFEGTACFRTRLKEISENPEDTRALRSVLRGLPEADPYLCILAADGDGMGARIAAIESKEAHQDFSAQLAKFAEETDAKVKEHFGVLVYSGGDDVLAFLPVDKAILCARKLHDRFRELTGGTLSVGLAIGHSMEPLEDLLDYARQAEKAAKGKETERDGLAVHYHPRGGAPLFMRDQWTAKPDEALLSLARMHLENLIPDKAGFDLRELSRIYDADGPDSSAVELDVMRLLKRKRVKDPEQTWAALLERMTSGEEVRKVADLVILARKLAGAELQARGPV